MFNHISIPFRVWFTYRVKHWVEDNLFSLIREAVSAPVVFVLSTAEESTLSDAVLMNTNASQADIHFQSISPSARCHPVFIIAETK